MATNPPPPPPAGPGPDARAVVRAAEELTTQVRRIADALATPVVRTEVAVDDDATTGIRIPLPGIPEYGPDCFCHRGDAEHAPAADKDACLAHVAGACDGTTRDCAFITDTGRSNVLLVLVDRAARGMLNDHEARALRARAQQVINGRERWKALAEEIEQDRDRIAAELETADRIRAEVQRDRDQHAAVLAEVLATFVHKVPGYRTPRVRSGEVDVVTLEKWRSVVAPTAERPWWQQVDEAREQAALDLGRDLLRDGLDAFLPRLVGPDNTARILTDLRGQTTALAEDLRYVLGYNGPGHAHEQPGVWDTSGKMCEHCVRLAAARQHLAAYDAGPDELPEPTAEETVRDHVTTLHLIGEQLAAVESWFWSHLADVRDTAAKSAERPRCPLCQLPHDLTPDSTGVRACESIHASLAEAERRHAEDDHGGCASVDCDVVRAIRDDVPAAGAEADRG